VRDAAAVGADADEGDDDDDDDEDDGDDDERSTDWMKCAKVRSNRAPAIWRGVNPPKVSALSAEYISCHMKNGRIWLIGNHKCFEEKSRTKNMVIGHQIASITTSAFSKT
jgi:hypothetical protein